MKTEFLKGLGLEQDVIDKINNLIRKEKQHENRIFKRTWIGTGCY